MANVQKNHANYPSMLIIQGYFTLHFYQWQRVQGSHTDWKTWKNGETFQSGKSQGILCRLEKSGKFREFLFFVLFLIELYLLKWIKFSVFRPTWWMSSVVIQFGESCCPTACTCSPSTDSILGLLLTSYTIWVGWP